MLAPESQVEAKLTGWHVLAMFGTGFGVIIAVNLALTYNAVTTFPGKETESSYVASQNFDADRAAQDALGWLLDTKLTDNALRLAIVGPDGQPVQPDIIQATLGRATTVADDVTPAFDWDGTALIAPVTAGAGNYNLRIEMRATDGTIFRRRIALQVQR